MIAVSAPLEIWTGAEGSSHFLNLPDRQSTEIHVHALMHPRGFRSVRVQCTIGDVTWQTSAFQRKGGGYFLPIKVDVMRRAKIAAGDKVTVLLELL